MNNYEHIFFRNTEITFRILRALGIFEFEEFSTINLD